MPDFVSPNTSWVRSRHTLGDGNGNQWMVPTAEVRYRGWILLDAGEYPRSGKAADPAGTGRDLCNRCGHPIDLHLQPKSESITDCPHGHATYESAIKAGNLDALRTIATLTSPKPSVCLPKVFTFSASSHYEDISRRVLLWMQQEKPHVIAQSQSFHPNGDLVLIYTYQPNP